MLSCALFTTTKFVERKTLKQNKYIFHRQQIKKRPKKTNIQILNPSVQTNKYTIKIFKIIGKFVYKKQCTYHMVCGREQKVHIQSWIQNIVGVGL